MTTLTHRMSVMGRRGDSEIRWDPADPASTARAREFFDLHAGSLYVAFQDDHGVGRQIPPGTFDPERDDDVVLAPAVVVG